MNNVDPLCKKKLQNERAYGFFLFDIAREEPQKVRQQNFYSKDHFYLSF